METETAYLTRRARQERASASDAASAASRAAHLELAVRLARAATGPALWRAWSVPGEDPSTSREAIETTAANVEHALAVAFPPRSVETFEDLLDRLG